MADVWFALLVATLAMFAVLDGWNIGCGIVSAIVARTEIERRQVIAALGPLWSWHEVWLIAAGATFLLAFPPVMASAFAGFYLAIWLILWSLLLRGIAIEVGGHVDDALWRSAWDFIFAASSVSLAVLLGAALGNVLRGVPVDAAGRFSLALFTDFGLRRGIGLLDWYTVSIAIFATVILAAHGATYLALAASGGISERARSLAARLWFAALALLPIVSAMTWSVRPDLFARAAQRPLAWVAAIALAAGVWTLGTGWRRRAPRGALAGSSLAIVSLLGGAAISSFPVMLHSTLAPEHSLTAHNGHASSHGLAVGLIWWPIAFALAIAYSIYVIRAYARPGGPGSNLRL
jgi:cytochrome bd ubiquinol oxidase subunit II